MTSTDFFSLYDCFVFFGSSRKRITRFRIPVCFVDDHRLGVVCYSVTRLEARPLLRFPFILKVILSLCTLAHCKR
ncbi:hypothetical protein RCL_jg3795.t1 [Rhizophagus clarus]|uniref:Uncharacterized protein n=1 Tax=Rhizophagus clarus TaxID=94130 RepID=A0A8H3QAC4_9GLOM|nr:hypothetical protein RCL_jg3795.t1 [Rhizophagus clarus]